MVSRKFVEAVKLDSRKQYEIAHLAGVHPVVLSQMINGYLRPKPGDLRVIRIGKVIGVSGDECFDRNEAITKAVAS